MMQSTTQAPQDRWIDAEDMRWAARHWATRMGVSLRQISVRHMTRKWASMSTAGRLTLNADLLDLPRGLGEYVIVHELVHLLAPNHGKVFTAFLTAYMPDWQEREALLRNFTHTQRDTARDNYSDVVRIRLD